MCGFAGLAFADRTAAPDRQQLARMTSLIQHRGPDAEGFHMAPGIAMGHRRLKVIDLAGGVQPMSDPTGQVTLAYNGEIYNFRALRRELEAAGMTFRTNSDTEVLLAGYLRWGECVADRLLGMYAFAIWDARSEQLLLVRDRLGVKPLYWGSTADGGLIFASELTPIVESGVLPRRLDLPAVAGYLSLGYVQGDSSMIEGVRRLPPASCLRWRRGHAPAVSRYWNLAAIWRNNRTALRSSARAEEEFAGLFGQAVEDRLVSDVPLGVFLSGGLDSSSVTAQVCRSRPAVETFSIGFEEASYDEMPWARLMADRLGTRHCVQTVRASDPELLLKVAASQDEPLADTSVIPTYALCKMARERVTVALSGDGGDELLAGYVTHVADVLHRRVSRLPSPLISALQWGAGLLPDSRRKVNLIFKAKQFLAGARLSACDAHSWWRMLAGPELVAELLGRNESLRDFDAFEPLRAVYREAEGLGPLDRFLYLDFKTWLPDDILVKVDRASMAHGLEVRGPFLDTRLVEFCTTVPEKLKLHGRTGKWLLRRTARRLVPSRIINRRKAGFNAPVSQWLAGSWRELATETLSPAALRATGVLDPAPVGRMLAEHLAGARDHGHRLFSLLLLTLWLNRLRPIA